MSGHHDSGTRDCRQIFESLSDYIDGELPPDLCARVDGHMENCPPCQAFLESLRRTVRLVETTPATVLPEEIRRSVREAYERYRKGEGSG